MGLVLDSLTKRYGGLTAVDGLCLEVPRGALYGFLGSNGAGKTTTLRMIMGLLWPDAGNITWSGREVDDRTRDRFGYLPEERGLYPKMRVRDHLIYLARLKGLPHADAARVTDGWLERLGVAGYARRRVEQLSRGNQQKVQFAAAVLHSPSLLILDEPFSGLDPVNAGVLQRALLDLHAAGVTILFSSHDMELVEAICQHVALIHRSRLLLAGELTDIKRRSRQQVARLGFVGPAAFLDRFPGVDGRWLAPDRLEVRWTGDLDAQEILRAAVNAGRVTSWDAGGPALREIYLQYVGGGAA